MHDLKCCAFVLLRSHLAFDILSPSPNQSTSDQCHFEKKGLFVLTKRKKWLNLYPIRTYWESDWRVLTGTGVVGLSLYEFGTDRGVGSWNVMVLEQEPVVYNNQPCVSWYPYFQVYNNPPCVSWSAYFQVLSPSNNSIHTSSAHGVWCILTFRYQLSGVSKLFQRSLLLIITITCSKSVLWKMLPPTVSAKFLMFWFPTLWFNLIVAPGWRQNYVPHIYKYWTSL